MTILMMMMTMMIPVLLLIRNDNSSNQRNAGWIQSVQATFSIHEGRHGQQRWSCVGVVVRCLGQRGTEKVGNDTDKSTTTETRIGCVRRNENECSDIK